MRKCVSCSPLNRFKNLQGKRTFFFFQYQSKWDQGVNFASRNTGNFLSDKARCRKQITMKNSLWISFLTLCFTLPSQANDLGFRLQGYECRNDQGARGMNPGFMGECGYLANAHLPGQMLQPGTRLNGADLTRANLANLMAERTDFTLANLAFANLNGSQLRGSRFDSARLIGITAGFRTNCEECDFTRVQADQADFNMASLRRTRFSGARFRGARFRDADFYFADLTFGDFSNADFRGADLWFADLFAADLRGAYFNSFTRLPFDRAEAVRRGMIFTN
jgi:uncharacterized protein YjbI with pentapeptide repeats